MTPKNNYKNYIPYVIILILLIGGIVGYVYASNTIADLQNRLAKYDNNQEKVEGEFVKINDEYNAMMASLSEKDQLLIESQQDLKDTNDQLQSILNKNDITENDLAQAQLLISQLKSQLKYQNEVSSLDEQIAALQEKNNKNEAELQHYQDLLKKKEILVENYQSSIKEKDKIIKKGSSLRLVNFEIKGINVKANGTEVETDKARKADKMRVGFYVNSNNISESGQKDLYMSLINSEGKLALFPDAEAGRIKLQNGESVDYTDHLSFHYDKGTSQPIKFDWENDNFEKGDYTIKVYENGVLIGSQSMSFR